MKFKKLADGSAIDLATYLKSYIKNNSNNSIRIYVGCDSHVKGEHTTYVSTVVIHVGNSGCHVLYKKEKVNPMSGCLPILVQIPVFFALYKVLFVTIEMRQMPFFGWIQDLSERDPTSLFNLFGLLPYDVPSFLMIGAWPIAMGVSMFIQQKLNPAPTDPMQAKIFMFFPLFLTVILAPFPAGLVIYWTVNNILTMAQQVFIMKRTTIKTTTT